MDRRRVRDTYDRIASHFDATRTGAWPEVEAFARRRPSGGTAVDIGCGNGRHAPCLAARHDRVVGIDLSRTLLAVARETAEQPVLGDATALPLADRSVSTALYIATIHHLPTRELRVRSLDDLERVLAPGGRALVSAWSTTADRFDRESGFDTTVPWELPDGESVERFYHIYDPAEFEADLRSSAAAVESRFTSSGNCYAVLASRQT